MLHEIAVSLGAAGAGDAFAGAKPEICSMDVVPSQDLKNTGKTQEIIGKSGGKQQRNMEIECDRVEKLVQGGAPSDVCCFFKAH